MRSRSLALAMLTLAVLSLLICASVDTDAKEDDKEEPGPELLYPDADYIITGEKNGSVMITHKEERTPTEDDPSTVVWKDKFLPQGSDHYLIKWTKITKDVKVVFDGAVMGDLALIMVDDASATQKFVSIEFVMVSGHIDTLSVVDVFSSQQDKLGDDYGDMFDPLVNVTVKLQSGHMECFDPTTDMIYVDNMEVVVGAGMTVDRFYTSGENGRYGNLFVGLHGGKVGYMTNLKSRVGALTYELDYGDVGYFAIGANTEHSGNHYLNRAPTSFVSGDLDLYINSAVNITSAILGGGVMEIPNILWNGDRLQDAVVRNFVIEAEGHTILADTCFMNEKRDKVLQFYNYEYGEVPKTTSMSTGTRLANGIEIPSYGEKGIWNGYNAITVNSGTSAFMNTTFVITPGGSLDIEMGGKVVSTYRMTVYGQINVIGEAVNNYLIELRNEGSISGRVAGDGMLADQISSQSRDAVISVMSDYDTVIITQEDKQTLRELTAKLLSGRDRVTIKAQYEGMGFVNDLFLVSLREMTVSESFVTGFDLVISGIDKKTLTACNVDISVPLSVPSGKTAKVYLYEPDTKDYREVEVISSDLGQVTFRTDAVGEYSIMFADAGETDKPAKEHKDDTVEIVLLVMGIAAVSAAMVYTFFKFRK